jgi:hypothetical protein
LRDENSPSYAPWIAVMRLVTFVWIVDFLALSDSEHCDWSVCALSLAALMDTVQHDHRYLTFGLELAVSIPRPKIRAPFPKVGRVPRLPLSWPAPLPSWFGLAGVSRPMSAAGRRPFPMPPPMTESGLTKPVPCSGDQRASLVAGSIMRTWRWAVQRVLDENQPDSIVDPSALKGG